MPQRNLFVILGAAIFSLLCYRATAHRPAERMLQRAFSEITQRYVSQQDEDKLVEAAIRGMVSQLDENSDFQSPQTSEELHNSLSQKIGGIGVVVNLDSETHQLTVVNPVAGTPAAKAGLLSGDRIVAIDNKPTTGFKVADAVKLIKGEPGTPVNLQVERSGANAPLSFQVVRAMIHMPSVFGDTHNDKGEWKFTLEEHPEIAYIRVSEFGEETVQEVRTTFQAAQAQGAKKLILDLRGNPGGLVEAALGMCNLFLQEGNIVSLQGRDGVRVRNYTADGKAPFADVPLAILVNRYSASASEIVSGCLQDQHRAVIIGERSYGKGTVQDVIPFEGGHSLKLTTAHYYRPSGKNIHRQDAKSDDDWGVKPDPDLTVTMTKEELEKYVIGRELRDRRLNNSPPSGEQSPENKFADPVLQKAVDYLEKGPAKKEPAAESGKQAS